MKFRLSQQLLALLSSIPDSTTLYAACFSVSGKECSSQEEGEEEEEEEDDETDWEQDDETDWEDVLDRPMSRQQIKLAKCKALKMSLNSGCYPEYKGFEGPYVRTDPTRTNPLDILMLLWPESLCDLLVVETNRYARDRQRSSWVDVNRDEILTFLGLNLLMAIHKFPRMCNLWSRDGLLGIAEAQAHMSSHRFWDIWSNLHVVDNADISPTDGITRKFKPVLDVLSQTFFSNYSPGQELSVDESMVKYKGRVSGKVRMPKKPIKMGFKIWCCCCSCCGYLCTFQVYEGKPTDLVTGQKVSEKGMVKRVVLDLLGPFSGLNHVVYCDNFFTSGPLVDALIKEGIYVAGTIKQTACGFPGVLRERGLSAGEYATERVGNTCYFSFNDRKVVNFATNAFPQTMGKVARLQPKGRVLKLQSVPPLVPAYNKFMGGVDRFNHLRKTYGYDRKSRRYWFRPFFQFFDYAVNNAFILYKHNCDSFGVPAMDTFAFRMQLIRLLLKDTRCRKRPFPSISDAYAQGGCSLERVSDIGLARGRCRFCVITKRQPMRYTSFGCSFCKVRLCKVSCFAQYHSTYV